MNQHQGMVYLVGAGPGDPGLITARGLDLVRRADVIVHDRIIGYELLADARADAVVVNVGKKPGDKRSKQDDLNRMMVEYARGGAMVVRLKGGDPFTFGRGYEELMACRHAGIDCVVVPGVSSALAAPASAGIPITSRQLVRSVAVISARAAHDSTAPPLDYAALARMDTVCVLMGRTNLGEVAANLMNAGLEPQVPAAAIEWGTTHKQRVTKAALAEIAKACDRDKLRSPVIVVVGCAAGLAVDDFNQSRALLAGKTVLISHRLRPTNSLRRRLAAAGATVIACDLVCATALEGCVDLDRALGEFDRYEWIVFDSPDAVRFFLDGLISGGRDLRALASTKLAVIGKTARRALRRRGLRANKVFATVPSAKGEIKGAQELKGASVLYPTAESSADSPTQGLRRRGANVHEVACYRRVARELPAALRERLREEVHAAVLTSADAARSFVDVVSNARSIPVICTSREAANQAKELGLSVDGGEPTNRANGILCRVVKRLEGEDAGSEVLTENAAKAQVP